jgi:uncharacterized protein (TIGR02996 family)
MEHEALPMSGVKQKFLDEIIHLPAEDAPRLAYAEWLSAQAHPRGEFIRVQCELARLDNDDPGRAALQARQDALWTGEIKGNKRGRSSF